ncbi:MAG: PAS domain-containing sensor histidine kinase [Bacteroidales bacterium]|nr:PAS domain-containing sensor histidine kinase [Bacteroidales bacterium]
MKNTNEKLEELVIERTRKITKTNEALKKEISEHIKTEMAFRESQSTLQSFYNSSSFMMGVCELIENKIISLYGNSATARFFGVEINKLPGKLGDYYTDNEENKLWMDKYIQSMKENHPVRFEYKRPNDPDRWLSAVVAYLGNGSSGFPQFSFICEDISERKYIEGQLIKRNRELIKINSVLEDFVYIAAHDLRSPIANMKMLEEYLSLTKDVDKKLSILKNLNPFIRSLERTIEGMIETIHVQKAEQSICKKLSFRSIFNLVILDLKDEINKGDAGINTHFDEADTIIYVEMYLISILNNLLSNAIKYASKDRKPHIEVSTSKINGYVLLKIKDNGIGIDLETYGNELFKPFKRLSDQADGTGMGLYIVKSTIEKNGGYIEVNSLKGEGTVFNCYLKEY